MSSVSYRSHRSDDGNSVQDQADNQDRSSTWLATERQIINELSASRASSNNRRTHTSLSSSPVSPISEHGHDMPTPTSSAPEAQISSAEISKKKSRSPALKKPGWWSRLIADSWTVELVAGFVSFAAIVSIVGVLWGYDQKPTPRLMKGITVSLFYPLRRWRWTVDADRIA